MGIIAIEGPNGVGKSTLISKVKERNADIYCVPPRSVAFQNAKELKNYIQEQACSLCASLFYLSVMVDLASSCDNHDIIVMDRSLYSTLAAAYSTNSNIYNKLSNIVEIIADDMLIPDRVIVLYADYRTCMMRSNNKPNQGVDDIDNENDFNKKLEFYFSLRNKTDNIFYINTDNIDAEEVYKKVINIIKGPN